MSPNPDVIVIGGGPAGSTASTLVAQQGYRVQLFERERFPRFHIGESLIPETNRYLEALGVYPRIEAEGFLVKRGAVIMAPDGVNERYAAFAEAQGIERLFTFEVPRARFDEILLEHAAASGADVREECRVRAVELRGEGVELRLEDGSGERTVTARFLVDASGRDGFLAKRLGLREVDSDLRQVGLHAWYEGVAPLPPERFGDTRLISIDGGGWAWLIPIDERVTSVGVVVPRERHAALPTGDPERCLEILLSSVPALPPLLARARRVSPVRVDADYSYATRAYAGERWLLTGDAGSFLDPIFSTGVLLALASGVEAAEAIDRALAAPDVPRAARTALAAFDQEQRRRYRFFRRFVVGYYRPELRDVLLSTFSRLRLTGAVMTALAGNTRPSFLHRLRIAVFFAVVRLQRFVAIVPRLHGRKAESRLWSDPAAPVAGGEEAAAAERAVGQSG
jgi:flavin-dependent dehydrogenase